jgi:hypothetical protein
MGAVKASAISLSLFGTLLAFVALMFGLQTINHSQTTGPGLVSLGFAVLAGFCFLGGALLTAVQPFLTLLPQPGKREAETPRVES